MLGMNTSVKLAQLGPLEQLRAGKLLPRLVQLVVGLTLFGVSTAMMIRANLGLAPWDALHVGLNRHLDVDFGWIVVGASFVVLLLWIPLREIPGLGTVANALIIGTVAQGALQVLDAPTGMAARVLLSVGGVLVCAIGSALYIGAQLGRGPRDGLMTGLHRVTGWSLRTVRTGLEASVLLVGLALGGSAVFGIGTVLFTLLIGPLTQWLLPWVLVRVERQVRNG